MRRALFLQLRKLGATVLSLMAAVAAVPVQAGNTQGNAEVTLVRPLSFVLDDGLDFGNVINGTTAGTVTVAPDGTRTKTGGVTLANSGSHKAASFAGMGANNQRVDISLGAASVLLVGPGAPMRVHTFVIGSTPTAVLTTTPLRFRINAASGVFAFPVGATLDVAANQMAGKYTGNWAITLDYF